MSSPSTSRERNGGAENAGVENAGVENAGADCRGGKCRSGKYRSDKVWKAIRRKYSKVPDEISASMPTFVGESKFRILIFLHFLDIYTITIDSVSDVSRVTRGLAIRRAKKRVNLTNDKRIKICIADI